MTLEMAVLHKAAVVEWRARIAHDPRFRWFHGSYAQFDEKLEVNTWHELQMVSVKDGQVAGWLSADFSRSHGEVTQLALARFDPKPSMEWARDMGRFFRLLFVFYGQHAVRWSVIVGSPHEGSYDRLVALLGGRMYGRSTESAVLPDGARGDHKLYEVLAANLNRHALDRLAGERYGSRAHDQAPGNGEAADAEQGNDGGRRGRGGSAGTQGPQQGRSVLRPEDGRADSRVDGQGVGGDTRRRYATPARPEGER